MFIRVAARRVSRGNSSASLVVGTKLGTEAKRTAGLAFSRRTLLQPC